MMNTKKKMLNKALSVFLAIIFMLFSFAVLGLNKSETVYAAQRGEVSYSGSGSLYGYTTNYVKYGGSFESQHRVYDGWHITAYDSYYSHGVTWYECWDTDDGDYYGWIDSSYLYFYSSSNSSSNSSSVTSYSMSPQSGYVNSSGVYGYTDNYVLYGGSQTVQHRVQNGWHITAYNYCYSHGVTWYECWDTDDGDYYGWVDSNYVSFYSSNNNSNSNNKQTVTVTVPVMVTVTVPVTVTVTVTEAATTPPATTLTTTATSTSIKDEEAIAAVTNKNDNDDSSTLDSKMFIIIAAAAIVLIAAASFIIAVVGKRSRTIHTPIDNNHNDNNYLNGVNNDSQVEELVFCQSCGTKRNNPRAVFCPKCGKPYGKNGFNQ